VLSEKRQLLAAKAKLWNECDGLTQTSDGTRDMSKKELLEKLGAVDANDAKGKIDALYLEIVDINSTIDELAYAEQKSGVLSIADGLKKPIRSALPTSRITDEHVRSGSW
jgi:hypothetical protein